MAEAEAEEHVQTGASDQTGARSGTPGRAAEFKATARWGTGDSGDDAA